MADGREVQRGNVTCVSCILGDCVDHQAIVWKTTFTKGHSPKQDQAPNEML